MNTLRKIWCRTYQTAFRVALPLLPYREPKLLENMDAVADLLAGKGLSPVLIVTDKGISSLGLLRGLTDALDAQGVEWRFFDEVTANPTIHNVEAARQMYLDEGCKALIAFGGGSSMDCAKACGARIVRPKKPVQKMRGLLQVMHRLPTLIAVPTTAGTGSETTLAAVITDSETKHKYPINDFSLIPHYAVLDPAVTAGLPAGLTATTGMDALTHAVEAHIGRSTTAHTRAMAIEAVQLIRQYLKRAYDNGQDLEARAKMLRAAYCAGIAFTQSYVGYVHGVAHSLGGQYGLPHGLANAIILPWFLEEYGPACHHRLGELARKTGVAPADASDAEAAGIFIAWVREMNDSMGIPRTVDCIQPEDIPQMAAHADQESNPLYPVPKLMDAEELAHMYDVIAGSQTAGKGASHERRIPYQSAAAIL
ncbi:iron-containing alcohol dehydrogenase [Faecalibacterium gallinarum]|uniref:Alcohol dehydrogenase n=1 Tax=Faecalibacterium gallinarum TaxID=2903556 RepID=A0AA37J300_9FIRM|nr:iron-containing alcohol dehydrogenase [Faecalibacterium gallinarum]GJN65869.1 alcohol dehydrogenase [Faecalibacterium gallinarum]